MNPAVAVLGIPLDENASFLRGSALAPTAIRQVLHSGSSNLCTEMGLNLSEQPGWQDLGDLSLASGAAAMQQIKQRALELLHSGAKLLSLGGDHSVSFPLIEAYAQVFANLSVLHIDAHSDLYHDFEGNPYSHASPFARIMEAGLVKRLVQVGIRTLNPHQRQQAQRFGVETLEMRHWNGALPDLKGPLYLSLDLDALDPAFAPGVSHHEPGGLSVREILNLIWQVGPKLVGADIVELNPARDLHDQTAAVAAKFYKELVGQMLRD